MAVWTRAVAGADRREWAARSEGVVQAALAERARSAARMAELEGRALPGARARARPGVPVARQAGGRTPGRGGGPAGGGEGGGGVGGGGLGGGGGPATGGARGGAGRA